MKRNFPSKIFIDGGNPEETKEAKKLLGFIDGQTTNPTLISKNPEVAARLAKGEKFSEKEAYDFYKKVVREIAQIVDWSVSIEPYADKNTTAEEILEEAREMFTWTDKAWIKFPTTFQGLKAASQAIKEGIRANLTLCFSQEQAAAVYSATLRPAKRGCRGQSPVFLSPFVGRLDDRGEDGMELIANILKMYKKGNGHVWVLTASLRNLNHLLYALKLGSPIITIPFKVFKEWADKDFPVPFENYIYDPGSAIAIPYREIALDKEWTAYDIHHDLTDIGIDRFSADWNALVK